MKVDGPGGPRGPQAPKDPKRTAKAGGPGFASALSGAGGSADDTDPVTAAPGGALGGLAGIDAILALQAVPDSTAEGDDARAKSWAGDLLDTLDELRLAILAGAIPRDRLRAIADTLSNRGAAARDPKLKELLGEIELRARVELAKYGD